MSRLDDECIMAVVRNRSGIDSGEIGYSILVARFEAQTKNSLVEIINILDILKDKCLNRIEKISDDIQR